MMKYASTIAERNPPITIIMIFVSSPVLTGEVVVLIGFDGFTGVSSLYVLVIVNPFSASPVILDVYPSTSASLTV